MHIKSVFNKDKYNHYYNILLKKIKNKNNISMLYCNKIDVSEKTDINSPKASNECGIWHYWYF